MTGPPLCAKLLAFAGGLLEGEVALQYFVRAALKGSRP
jgi:hypothetical protein